MSFPRPQVLLLAIGVAALALASQKAGAETYPSRPVHLVVAFVPGGATDTLARQISNDLKETLGQPVVVENRPGANGYLAWNHVAAAEPDGYTLLLAENALAISQALHKKATSSFDPLTQYDPIAGIATSPSALIVANNIPARSVAELVAYSRTVPQKMNYASAGVGSVSHLNFEVFKDAVGMEAIHIPYKGPVALQGSPRHSTQLAQRIDIPREGSILLHGAPPGSAPIAGTLPGHRGG
jgi:tripartite-type tricarboxylate transporter receptor subunit TctC